MHFHVGRPEANSVPTNTHSIGAEDEKIMAGCFG